MNYYCSCEDSKKNLCSYTQVLTKDNLKSTLVRCPNLAIGHMFVHKEGDVYFCLEHEDRIAEMLTSGDGLIVATNTGDADVH